MSHGKRIRGIPRRAPWSSPTVFTFLQQSRRRLTPIHRPTRVRRLSEIGCAYHGELVFAAARVPQTWHIASEAIVQQTSEYCQKVLVNGVQPKRGVTC